MKSNKSDEKMLVKNRELNSEDLINKNSRYGDRIRSNIKQNTAKQLMLSNRNKSSSYIVHSPLKNNA